METAIKKRTSVDFSKHKLHVIKNEYVLIHHLKKPDSNCENIKFINAGGVLSVTGDRCNWIFCREFHPSAKEDACNYYWTQKLKIASCQNPYEFDVEGTIELIDRMIQGEKEEENRVEIIEYLEDCKDSANDSEFWYDVQAYSNKPDGWDYDDVPKQRKLLYDLQVVYDAFDEICRRLKETPLPPAPTN